MRLLAAAIIVAARVAAAQDGSNTWDARNALGPLPVDASLGGTMTPTGDGRTLYVFPSPATDAFYRYDVADGTWTLLDGTGLDGTSGGGLAWDGSDFLYCLRNVVGCVILCRYSISRNDWSYVWDSLSASNRLEEIPPVGTFSALFIANTDLYATGTGTSTIYRYEFSSDEWPAGRWIADTDLPANVDGSPNLFASGATAAVSGGEAFLFQGALKRNFWKFTANERAVVAAAPTPVAIFRYPALCRCGSGTLYAIGGASAFWEYSVIDDAWTAVATPPATFGQGAAIVYAGQGDRLYAFRGYQPTGTDNTPAEFWRYTRENHPPRLTSIGQFRRDGITPIAAGEIIGAPAVELQVRGWDPDDDRVRYEVEIKEVGSAPDGTNLLVTQDLDGGTSIAFRIGALPPGTAYQWRARAVDTRGRIGAWADFGVNAPGEPDFATRANVAPQAPRPAQVDGEDGHELEIGGATSSAVIEFRAQQLDLDVDDELTLEVELRPAGQAFTGAASLRTTGAGVRSPELAPGAYSWRCRTVDIFGAASAWISFGGDDETADFKVRAFGSEGHPACGQSARAHAGMIAGLALLALAIFGRRADSA